MFSFFPDITLSEIRTLDALALGSAALLSAWLYSSQADKRRRRGLPYPPGPPRLPILGNVMDLPNNHEWITYRDWARKYASDVIHLDVLGGHLVVVNSAKAANDLFDKRSSLYSDRPTLTSLTEYLGFDWAVGFISYGAKWRALRKGFHAYFHPEAARTYEPLEMQAANTLLKNLLETPDDFLQHIRHMTGQVILRIAYGYNVKPQDDYFVNLAERATQSVTLATSLGGSIFDIIPFMKYVPWWIPGAGFKKEAEKWRPTVQAIVDEPFAATKAAVERGDAPLSVAATIIAQDCDPLIAPAQLPANFYLGGADTTATAIQNFFLAMVLYPEAQRKAQAEIDSVTGGIRLPTFDDAKFLPYVSALAKEVQRWHPVVPLAIPHRLREDDIYEDKFIPAGSVVLGNIWAILHDPELFPDPETFRPEHYLPPSQGGTLPKERATRLTEAAFGFGRRECPGRFMARSSLWIAAASVLTVFDISPALDEAGNPIQVEEKHLSGIVAYPAPFKCQVKPRSEKARELLLAMKED